MVTDGENFTKSKRSCNSRIGPRHMIAYSPTKTDKKNCKGKLLPNCFCHLEVDFIPTLHGMDLSKQQML